MLSIPESSVAFPSVMSASSSGLRPQSDDSRELRRHILGRLTDSVLNYNFVILHGGIKFCMVDSNMTGCTSGLSLFFSFQVWQPPPLHLPGRWRSRSQHCRTPPPPPVQSPPYRPGRTPVLTDLNLRHVVKSGSVEQCTAIVVCLPPERLPMPKKQQSKIIFMIISRKKT